MRKNQNQSDWRSQSASATQGFTLVEVLLVLALLLVLAAMALPGIAGWQSRMANDQSVTAIQSACQQARILAIQSGMTYSVSFDSAGDGGQIQPLSQGRGTSDARSFRIGREVASVTLVDTVGRRLNQLQFYPGGRSTAAQIVVTDTDGAQTHLQLDRLTGMVRSQDILNNTSGS